MSEGRREVLGEAGIRSCRLREEQGPKMQIMGNVGSRWVKRTLGEGELRKPGTPG